MSQSLIPGRPHWELPFDENGNRKDHAPFTSFLAEAPACTDVLIMSHGWNNDHAAARDLYQRFFKALGDVLATRAGGGRAIGTAGVLWPSILWPEDRASDAAFGGGAAALGDTDALGGDDAEFLVSLGERFPGKADTLARMGALLREASDDPARLDEFHRLMVSLDEHAGAVGPEDDGEQGMKTRKAEDLFRDFDEEMPGAFGGGAAGGIGSGIAGLWNGARQATRMFTYWQMKKRAGVVGEKGLGRELVELKRAAPATRVHLIGHSFGARLVSYALRALPEGAGSNVASVFLAQGAFSHYSFADALPYDTGRSGALKGMMRRVSGPLCATHSRRDSAVGKAYPLASRLSREDAAAAEDQIDRWGAIGSDGAQGIRAASVALGPVGTAYEFVAGTFTNLDGNGVIIHGDGPSGSHSDIVHPEIAWALAQAARLVQGDPVATGPR